MEAKFILVVEDDPILKNLLGHTFAGKYQTLYASNGTEALALFEQYKPGLVLLDLMLPDVDGFTVLQTIRTRTDAMKDTPVIIISNLGAETDKEKAISLGANDYLVKAEVEVSEIVGHIEKALGVQGMAAGEAPAAPIPTPAQASAEDVVVIDMPPTPPAA
jgi:DNA-binding response OmpR family regulator